MYINTYVLYVYIYIYTHVIILLYTILYYTILYYTILYYTILYYTILYYTILYCTILYYTILYYTILQYTILYDIRYTIYDIPYTMLYTVCYTITYDYTILTDQQSLTNVYKPFILRYVQLCVQTSAARFPLPLTGPYRLEGTALANRLAASHKYKEFYTRDTVVIPWWELRQRSNHWNVGKHLFVFTKKASAFLSNVNCQPFVHKHKAPTKKHVYWKSLDRGVGLWGRLRATGPQL